MPTAPSLVLLQRLSIAARAAAVSRATAARLRVVRAGTGSSLVDAGQATMPAGPAPASPWVEVPTRVPPPSRRWQTHRCEGTAPTAARPRSEARRVGTQEK